MKTINLLTSHFLPENVSATNRLLTLAKLLQTRYRINIFVITERNKPQKQERVKFSENIEIYYVNYIVKNKNFTGEQFFQRALYELKYSIRLVRKAKNVKADITIASTPFMFIIPALALFGKGKRIVDIRDLVWLYIDENSKFKKIIKKSLTALMKRSLAVFDWVTVTNNFEKEWVERNVPGQRVTRMTNGIEEKRFEKLCEISYGMDTPFTVTYIGNVGIAQNIQILVDAVKDLENIRAFIVGEGPKYISLKQYLKEYRINNVKMFGKIPREELYGFYQQSHVLYTQLDEKFAAAVPSKIYEYISTGLPLIYAGKGIAREFVQGLENVLTIDPNKVEDLKEAILHFYRKRDQLKISEKNRVFIKKSFLREAQSRQYFKIIQTVLEER